MRHIFYIFAFSRIYFIIFALIASLLIPLQNGYLGQDLSPTQPYLLWIWSNFDGIHYLNIASFGYSKYNFAFFPLYSLIIFFLGHIVQLPFLYIGIFISLLFMFLTMLILRKIILLDYDKAISTAALLSLAFFPLAFFYHSVYTDALFLLLSTTSFYFARRGNWFLCGIFGGLSTFDRLSGMALLPALLVEWFIQNPKFQLFSQKYWLKFVKTGAMALTLTSFGILTYLIYLQIYHGNWLLFQKSMAAWHQDHFIFPLQTIFRYIKILIFVNKHLFIYWLALTELISTILYLILSVFVLKKVRSSYGIFMIVLLFLVPMTGTLAGTPRYILHLFPGFIAMGILSRNHKTISKLIFVLFIVLGFIFTGLFTRGYFIA